MGSRSSFDVADVPVRRLGSCRLTRPGLCAEPPCGRLLRDHDPLGECCGPVRQAKPAFMKATQKVHLLVCRDLQRAIDPERLTGSVEPAAGIRVTVPDPLNELSFCWHPEPPRHRLVVPQRRRLERAAQVEILRQLSGCLSTGSYLSVNPGSGAIPDSSSIAVWGILNVEQGANRSAARAGLCRRYSPVVPFNSTKVPLRPSKWRARSGRAGAWAWPDMTKRQTTSSA